MYIINMLDLHYWWTNTEDVKNWVCTIINVLKLQYPSLKMFVCAHQYFFFFFNGHV